MLSYLRKILRSISTRIIIGGDFSNDLFGVPLKELSSKNAEKVFDKGVLRLFKTADELVVNLECAVTVSENRIKGLAVVLEMDKSGIKFTPVPVVMKDNMLYLAEGKEKDKILNGLKERGKTLADGSYINGWRAFCDTVPWYKTAVPPENSDMLGHWLDCEAHYDVLRELYKTYNHTNELD